MKLRSREKYTLGAIGVATYLSGVALYLLSQWIRVATEVGEQHHPSESWVRVVHFALTYFVLLSIGYLMKGHVIPGLKAKAKRRMRTGLTTLALFAVLAVTALLILYSGEVAWHDRVAQIHAFVGLASPLLILFHAWKRREVIRTS